MLNDYLIYLRNAYNYNLYVCYILVGERILKNRFIQIT